MSTVDDHRIRFDDGVAYEDFMGVWSRAAGVAFLDWLAPAPGRRWIDVGCGNGAFTELLIERSAPASVDGVDPSEAQLDYARNRLLKAPARFAVGDAMDLPCADASFDDAVMALVIFFLPDPAKGVSEMTRVVVPGGSVSAYAWDVVEGGFPYAPLHEEMTALGMPPLRPPSIDAAREASLRDAWTTAGLVEVETKRITVERAFDDFESFWRTARKGPRLAPRIDGMPSQDLATLRDRVRARLPADAAGRVTLRATANAVKGRVASKE